MTKAVGAMVAERSDLVGGSREPFFSPLAMLNGEADGVKGIRCPVIGGGAAITGIG